MTGDKNFGKDESEELDAGRFGRPGPFELPEELPVLPVVDVVVFPHGAVPLDIRRKRSLRLMEEASAKGRMLAVVGVKSASEEPGPDDLLQVGTAVSIVQMLKMPDGSIRALAQGLVRVNVGPYTQVEPYLRAQIKRLEEVADDSPESQGLTRNLLSLFQRAVGLAPFLSEEMFVVAANLEDAGQLCDFIAYHMNLKSEQRQELLEILDIRARLIKLTRYVNDELEILEIGSKIQAEMKQEMDKGQREAFLRAQLRAIQRELGEEDEATQEANELHGKIEKADLSPEAKKEAEQQLERLLRMHPASPERAVARTYLDWLLELPWTKGTEDRLDLKEAAAILEADHYDLEKVKERILEYLAVRKLKQDMKGPILCFVGPPGVGKTSMGQSIARALGRKFLRLSLGGVRDEAEIRGHRRTYVGSLPGNIIQGIRKAGSNNPVFMLDEVDKVGADFRGDPSAALLEVLDPEQNSSFEDHYLALPFDLSSVMFITTANLMEPILPALRDRMEIIHLPGYTEPQKTEIARRFLIPKQIAENGLPENYIDISPEALARIINDYTREAGVRNLEREIAHVLRKIARKLAEDGAQPAETIHIDDDSIPTYLGPRRFRGEVTEGEDEIGVATGLAVTEAGGEILFVEATLIPGGKGNLILTGRLGDVMQESARAALTYATTRSQKFGVSPEFKEKYDIHIHVPAGATPKDGPSAGVAMASALVSAITRRPLHKHIAMTGEITLRGRVLPIGGVKEKVLAAHRAGCTEVILPGENDHDLEELPDFVRRQMKITFVNHIDELLPLVLAEERKEEPFPEPEPVAFA